MLRFDHIVKIVDDFELRMDKITLNKGHIVGVFGRNGAGKSTFFTCLSQLRTITRGTVFFQDEVLSAKHKTDITMTLNQYLPLNYSIEKTGRVFMDIYPAFDYPRYLEGCRRLQVKTEMMLSEGSKGVKQKVSNLLALCSGCKVICLDEPFGGLDPFARKVFQQLILEASEEDNLILVSSHQISELELLVDSFIFFDKGQTAYVDDLDTLREIAAKDLKQIVREVEHETVKK